MLADAKTPTRQGSSERNHQIQRFDRFEAAKAAIVDDRPECWSCGERIEVDEAVEVSKEIDRGTYGTVLLCGACS